MRLISAHFTNSIVELIVRKIKNRGWLYWPPGPMTNQVFDKEACKADIDALIRQILEEKQDAKPTSQEDN